MITSLFTVLKKSIQYTKNHPQLLFVLSLLILLPLLFVYTGQQFLDVGRANQDRLQKDTVGVMHDVFASLLIATNFDIEQADKQLTNFITQNTNVEKYIIAKNEGTEIVVLSSTDNDEIGLPIAETELYSNAALRTNESLIFEQYTNSVRYWHAYRAIRGEQGELYFLYTKISQGNIDALFKNREQKAYFSLLFVYGFVIALAFWHIKLTDYRFLYIEAQKANQMQDLFTNTIAHELRTPLTAIKGYASLLKDSIQTESEKTQAKRIGESAERMLLILTDLLDVARLQSGKLLITKVETDVSIVINNVLAELKVVAQEKQITLVQENIETKHLIETDPKRLQQILTNIVSNAIKYTKEGSITIAVQDQHAWTEIRVKDTGMGIASDDQKKLFAPFFRVSSAAVSNITGTGLGMWITKELVERMGGTIGIESIKGVGTHVVVKLPNIIRIN